VGTVELAVPKLWEGSFVPDWLPTHRRRAGQALVTVVATAYLLGVSTRRVERLAAQLGVKSLSRSQVRELAAHLDAQVAAFRELPLDAGPYTFVWADALTVEVREDSRVVNVHAIATGVNADGHREILDLDVASARRIGRRVPSGPGAGIHVYQHPTAERHGPLLQACYAFGADATGYPRSW
jgi:putative transposase